MTKSSHAQLLSVLAEIRAIFECGTDDLVSSISTEIDAAKAVFVHSAGRTGLVLRGFVMRLHHLGLPGHVVGDMTTPPIGPGDLLVVNASTGDLPSGIAHMQTARRAGARILVITAAQGGAALLLADKVATLRAQTMLDDAAPLSSSVLPMGSQYELALFLLCELVVLDLAQRRGISFMEMRSRHANLL